MRPLGVPSDGADRVGAEVGEQRQAVLGGQAQRAPRPELVEVGHRRNPSPAAPLARTGARSHSQRGAALGELLAEAETIGQRGEGRVVVAGLRVRLGERGHGDQQRVVAASRRVVVALEGRGRRHHDVGVLGHRGPVRVVHDDGVGPAERAPQPGEVLVVVERVAARPVHQPDVGVGQRAAVVVERLAGMQQHVADCGHRDERLRPGWRPAGASAVGTAAAAARARSSSRSRGRNRLRQGRSGRASPRAPGPSTAPARRAGRAAATS